MQVFIARGEDSSGPYTMEQVRAYLAEGLLRPDDLAYHEGLDGWTPLGELITEAPAADPDDQPSAQPEPVLNETPSSPAKRPRKKLVMAGIALGLFVLCGGVAAALLIKKKANDEARAAAEERRANQPKTEITPGARPGPVTLPKPPDANETLPPDPGTLPVTPPINPGNTNEVTQPPPPPPAIVADTPSAKMIEASIRRMISKPEGDLTTEDFAKVTRLSVGAGTGKVSDLSFLANCPNLESIYAQSQAITNLAPLAKLPKLKDISISFNPVKDLTPLAGLSELQELWLQGAPVEDVTPLAGLTKLETLYLDRNQALTDLKPLAGLPALQHLSLYEMGALDLSPLANLPKLEKLNLAKLPPESLATLKPPAGLKELVFSPGPDSDLAALFGGIDALEKLRVTDARRMGLRKLVDAVKSHESLVDLGLPLGGVDDATPLADLPNLERLDLAGNFIEDLKPFAGLEQLNTLLLSGNRVKDVAPLVGCKKLGILWLQGNPVEDVTPLHDMGQLRSVTLRGTAVTEENREALRQAITNCFVDNKRAEK